MIRKAKDNTQLTISITSEFRALLNSRYSGRISQTFEKVMRNILQADDLLNEQENENELQNIETQIVALKIKADLYKKEQEQKQQKELNEYSNYEKKNWSIIMQDFKEIFWDLSEETQNQIKNEHLDYINKNQISDNEYTLVHHWARNYRKEQLKNKLIKKEID